MFIIFPTCQIHSNLRVMRTQSRSYNFTFCLFRNLPPTKKNKSLHESFSSLTLSLFIYSFLGFKIYHPFSHSFFFSKLISVHNLDGRKFTFYPKIKIWSVVSGWAGNLYVIIYRFELKNSLTLYNFKILCWIKSDSHLSISTKQNADLQ